MKVRSLKVKALVMSPSARRSREWRKNEKAKFREHIGIPECTICRYTDIDLTHFDFHHVYPKTKDFNISEMLGRYKFETWKEELNKTILICHRCHRELHKVDLP